MAFYVGMSVGCVASASAMNTFGDSIKPIFWREASGIQAGSSTGKPPFRMYSLMCEFSLLYRRHQPSCVFSGPGLCGCLQVHATCVVLLRGVRLGRYADRLIWGLLPTRYVSNLLGMA